MYHLCHKSHVTASVCQVDKNLLNELMGLSKEHFFLNQRQIYTWAALFIIHIFHSSMYAIQATNIEYLLYTRHHVCRWIYTLIASLVVQMVKSLPAAWETGIWFLGRDNPLEKEMAIRFSILTWKTPWAEEPGRLQSKESQELDMTKHAGTVDMYIFLMALFPDYCLSVNVTLPFPIC